MLCYIVLSIACHPSCDTCSGPGNDACNKCDEGYELLTNGARDTCNGEGTVTLL